MTGALLAEIRCSQLAPKNGTREAKDKAALGKEEFPGCLQLAID